MTQIDFSYLDALITEKQCEVRNATGELNDLIARRIRLAQEYKEVICASCTGY